MTHTRLIVFYRPPLAGNIPTRNIPVIEKIYGQRFTDIHHLVPFYQGEQTNITPVYEFPLFQQGFFAQAFQRFFSPPCQHYLFISDDTLLNPCLDENNLSDHLKLDQETSFCIGVRPLDEKPARLVIRSMQQFVRYVMGPAVQPLPRAQEAKQIIQGLGIDMSACLTQNYPYSYPFITAPNNMFVVDKNSIRQFCHFCGIFAAKRLAVEVAIPTALALTAQKLRTLKEIAFTQKTRTFFFFPRKKSLKKLQVSFPDTCLYVHPMKLDC